MMKVKNLIISLVFVALTLIGWITVVASSTSEVVIYNKNLKQAQKWVEEGLYQRAIKKYNEAIEYNGKEKNYELLFKAYELRLAEDAGIAEEYIVDLTRGVQAHPDNYNFHKRLISLYEEAEEFEAAYKCILNALEYHEKDELIEMKNRIRYMGELEGINVDAYNSFSQGYYTVNVDGEWAVVDAQKAKLQKGRYEYMSPLGENQTRIETSTEDSRLVCEDNFVLGIFEEKVYEAGIFADGLIPVKMGDKYYYVDEFAKKAFKKGYDAASSFKNGVAAVKDGDSWYFIDTNGEKASDKFADVVLDKNLSYTLDENFVAAQKKGKYAVYNSEFEQVSEKTYEGLDFGISDEILAFKEKGKWGFVTLEGEVIIKPVYEDAKGFSNGLAAVCQKGKWGFVNTDGDIVIACKYEDADYFNAYGTCFVTLLNEENYSENAMYVLEFGILEE